MTRQLLLADKQLLPRIWPIIEPLLYEHKELWEKNFKIQDIYQWLQEEKLQLWCSNTETEFDGAVLSCFVEYPQKKSLCLIWSNIEYLDECMYLLDCVEMWASRHGASEVLILGRRGWLKKLHSRGYVTDHHMVSKDISNLREC